MRPIFLLAATGGFDVRREQSAEERNMADVRMTAGPYETEILFPYGPTSFASKLGQLAGNHFLTITDGLENLRSLGEMTLWTGAQDIVFDPG